jgi:acetyl-CoA acyltransferase
MAGAYDIVVAAGVEVMTRAHGRLGRRRQFGFPFGPKVMAPLRPEGGLVPQGISAEMIADKWGISREDLDAFGARASSAPPGHRRGPLRQRDHPGAGQASRRDGKVTELDEMVTADEGIRPDTTVESLANLKPAFKEDGKVTAGNSSQITDGASAVLIMSEEKAAELGLKPRARFHSFALAGVDPVMMLTGPIPATHQGAGEGRLTMDDIDLSRSTRPSPRSCWRGRRSTTPTCPRST